MRSPFFLAPPSRLVRRGAFLVVLVTLAGCTSVPAGLTCSHAPATSASPTQLVPCARDAANAWRASAQLYAVEGAAGTVNGTPVTNEYRPLDGYAPEWGFTFADLDAGLSKTFVVLANGSVREQGAWNWTPGDAPLPHRDGYGKPLALASLETPRLHDIIGANATGAPFVNAPSWHAYSLVSTKEKLPSWFVITGGSPRGLYAVVGAESWRLVEAHTVPTG